jgi:hypothetical protein
LCRFYEEDDETFFHLIRECPCSIKSRVDIFLERLIFGLRDWDLGKLVEFSHERLKAYT